MKRDARFWRNVAIITVAHLAVLLALARASRNEEKPNLHSVVWMNSAAAVAQSKTVKAEAPERPHPSPTVTAKLEASPSPTPAKSEIQMPSPTPTATVPPKPSPTPTAKSSPKPTEKPEKPTPKATPKKSATPKPTPKSSPKKEKESEEKTKPTEEKKSATKEPPASGDKSVDKSASPGSGSGAAKSSEFSWYGSMLHDRFYKAWNQPTSSVASGAKMSTIVKIRIEKDGRVSKFNIVKSSGNVVVDESVTAIAQKVTQVDPLPEGLAKGSFYEVKIDFELNAEN